MTTDSNEKQGLATWGFYHDDEVEPSVIFLESTLPHDAAIERLFEEWRRQMPTAVGRYTLDDVNIEVDVDEREIHIVPRVVPRKRYLALQSETEALKREVERLNQQLIAERKEMALRSTFDAGAELPIHPTDPPSEFATFRLFFQN